MSFCELIVNNKSWNTNATLWGAIYSHPGAKIHPYANCAHEQGVSLRYAQVILKVLSCSGSFGIVFVLSSYLNLL